MSSSNFSCSTCDKSFLTAEEQRRHAKSDWHVEMLRCRAVAAGTVTASPIGSEDGAGGDDTGQEQSYSDGSRSDDETPDGFQEGREMIAEFELSGCIFCPEAAASLDDILSHMNTAHGFSIPYADALAVEVDTLIWYLHLVIFRYHECISCGTRRRTVEAVQQHMVDKGHCRFELSDDMAEFYNLEDRDKLEVGELARPDDESLRIPSGKILLHRTRASWQHQSRLRTEPPIRRREQHAGLPSQAHPTTLTTRDRKELDLAARISRLRVTDRQGLAHLPVSQQRSVLAQQRQQLDSTRRAQGQMHSQVERLGNRTLMKYFVNDVPGRSNG